MIGKIPTWWENSVRGKRKTVGKVPPWWEIFLCGRKKVFRCMDHLVLRHPSYMRGFTYPFSLSAQSIAPSISSILNVSTTLGGVTGDYHVFTMYLYHRELILETSTLSCNEEEEDITKPPKR